MHNNEINAVVLSTGCGRAMEEMLERDMEQSDRIDPQRWRDRGVLERIHEDFARGLQPLL